MDRFHMHIDGRATEAAGGEWFESEDPFTGKAWATLPRGRAEDADKAVKSAHAAYTQGAWAEMSPTDRGLLLHRIGDLVAANAERLADLEVADNGKLRAEMVHQMKYLPRWFQYFGGMADKVEGHVTPIDKAGMFHYVTYEPLGRDRGGHAVELAALADDVEARAGAGGGQHGGGQAVGVLVGVDDRAGRHHEGGRAAAGRRQRGHRLRGRGR